MVIWSSGSTRRGIVYSKCCLIMHHIAQICVVSVVEMAGSGKSTLAKKIYSDPRVKQHFHASTWISVSEKYRFLDLIKDIARRIMGITRNKMVRKEKDQDEEGTSGITIQDKMGKEDGRELLLREFRSGARMKVTNGELNKMGEEDVRELLREFCSDGRMEVTVEELDKMGEEDVRELLRQFRSGGRMEVTIEELDRMGEEDVRELLREFLADRKFLLVLDDVWKSNSYSEINRILSALPDANNGSRIIPHRPNWTMEDTAREYIKELAQRCMLQTVERSKWHSSIKSVVLHDMVREWGIAEARKEGLFNIWSNPIDAEPFSDLIMSYGIALHNYVGRTEINVAMPKLRT